MATKPPPQPTPDTGFRETDFREKPSTGAPTFKINPSTKKSSSTAAAFNAFVKAHPQVGRYADSIRKWAQVYGIDPVYLAALISHESGGNPAAEHTNTNGSRDLGLAQINSIHYGKTQTPFGVVTAEKALNPAFAIHFAAWYFGGKVSNAGGDYAAAYSGTGGYNPGGPNPFTGLVPKGYVPNGKGLSPTEAASVSVETAGAKATLTDPWITLKTDKKGNVVGFGKVFGAEPPKNALKYGNEPVTESGYTKLWKQGYADTFFAYTGRAATAKEVAVILGNAPSFYSLSNTLAKAPGFAKSPTYKAHAPGVLEIARQFYGQEWKPDSKLVARAIAENWDPATLQANLRKRPEFLTGPVFKGQVEKFKTMYAGIYGNPGPNSDQLAQEVALQGWSEDQFASWLRGQPAYKNSGEYKAKVVGFAQTLGLITGEQASIHLGQLVSSKITGAPDSKRIPGSPTDVVTQQFTGEKVTA